MTGPAPQAPASQGPPWVDDAPPRRRVAFLPLFLRLKWRLADNHLANFHRHLWVHLGVGLMVAALVTGGGTTMFCLVFRYLNNLEAIGALLMDRLIKLVLLAFFSMLTFSNLIIMLTTTYLSREVESLMSHPIEHRQLYFGKLCESIVYSSWAFLMLACPLFVSIGLTRRLDWTYYAGAATLVAPFLIVPAALGALGALVVTVWFPPRQIFRFALAMMGIGVVGALVAQRFYGLDRLLGLGAGPGGQDDLERIARVFGMGDFLALPSDWLGRGLSALERHDWAEAALWGGMLWSTAAMGVVVLDALAGPFYFRGWCNARSAPARRRASGGLYRLFDRLFFFLPRPTRALVTKDLAVFWRDPAQWSQLLILFGLLFIYFANLRSTAGMVKLEAFIPGWRALLAMMNIGATTFVLSIMTTRFVFPMLSLEGRQQWIIGLAPIGRSRLVWVKFIVSWLASTALTLPLAMLSSRMLAVPGSIVLLTGVLVTVMAAGLSAMAVGLGALMPSFGDDNPARIASGLGGTINAVASLAYQGLSLALAAPWAMACIHGHAPLRQGLAGLLFWGAIPAWALVQAVAIAVPMALGLRRWRKMEF
jgi:ABC-2 type transport system permease protein